LIRRTAEPAGVVPEADEPEIINNGEGKMGAEWIAYTF
jgi:hypothetical protein